MSPSSGVALAAGTRSVFWWADRAVRCVPELFAGHSLSVAALQADVLAPVLGHPLLARALMTETRPTSHGRKTIQSPVTPASVLAAALWYKI
jgi:hypothetical protein